MGATARAIAPRKGLNARNIVHTDSCSQSSVAASANSVNAVRRPRMVYGEAYKRAVVEQALQLPAGFRIKPTCKRYPNIVPVRRYREPVLS